MKQFRLIFSTLFLVTFLSCSKVVTLNFEKHFYDVNATKIIWIQLPGYSEELPMLLKLAEQDARQKTPLESFSCAGKAWTYNLYNLKPSPIEALHHQLTGSKNIKNKCEDFINRPIWDLLAGQGFKTAVLERGAKKNEQIFRTECSDEKDFKKNLSYFHMAQASGDKPAFFHAEDPVANLELRDYFDRACQSGSCVNTLFDNIKMLVEKALLKEDKFLFMVRDFSLLRAFEQTKTSSLNIKLVLQEISKVVGYINILREQYPETLILLTSGQSLNIEVPLRVNADFMNSPSSYSAVLAKGAGAENFCGYMEHEDIFKRILWKSGYNF